MKSLLFSFLLILGGNIFAGQPHYATGDQLTVVARSGLHLRMEPSVHGKILRTLSYGDVVCIENTFNYADSLRDRSDWLTGHWVLVSYLGTEGYLFDAYLSSMPLPDHESQLCIDCNALTQPLINYITAHFAELGVENYSRSGELSKETILTYTGGIVVVHSSNDTWLHTEVVFSEHNLNEVLNTLRGMLVGMDQRNAFEAGLIFKVDPSGVVNAITSRGIGNALRINRHGDGSVSVASWVPLGDSKT